jgi:hypothetical protein
MSGEQTPRDLTNAKWYLNDVVGHKGTPPTGICAFVYSKAVIEIASADGTLDEDGLSWIIGFAGSIGKVFFSYRSIKILYYYVL